VPQIRSIPLLLVAIILITWLLGPTIDLAWPQWTKPFVTEYPLDEGDVDHPKISNRWSVCAIALIFISFCAISAQAALLTSSHNDTGIIVNLLAWVSIFRILGLARLTILKVALALLILIKRPRQYSALLLLFYISILISEGSILGGQTLAYNSSRALHVIVQCAALISICIVLLMPFRDTASDSNVGATPSEKQPSPEDNLKPWQFLSVSWMWPMISVGKKRTLNEDDVWKLSYQFQHQRLHDRFSKLKGSVLGRLCRANITDFFIISFLAIFSLVAGKSF